MPMRETDKNKKEFTPLGDAIRDMLRRYHIEDKFNEQTLVDNWPKIVGAPAAEKSKRIFIRNHVLFVEISSPSLKHELSLNKELLLKRIFDDYPGAQIKEIVIM